MYNFGLDGKQIIRLHQWLEEVEKRAYDKQTEQSSAGDPIGIHSVVKRPYYGAIGGGLTFSFTPTGIGTVVRVTEAITGEVLDLTDYDMW